MTDSHMNKMYESLKEAVHEISHRSKGNPIPLASVKQNHASSLSEEINKVEDFIAQKIEGLRAAAQQREEAILNETQVIESLKETIAMLESKLKEAEESFREKESISQTLEATLTAKIHGLQDELQKNKETLQIRDNEIAALEANKEIVLAARDAEINDLKFQLQLLTRWVKEMPAFCKQAETLTAVDDQNGSTAVISERKNGVEEKPAGGELKGLTNAFKATPPAQPPVPPTFFDLMTQELTLIKGPMASVIVRDHVAALGESMEAFPRSRLPALLEVLSEEIVNRNVKIAFRKWFVKHV